MICRLSNMWPQKGHDPQVENPWVKDITLYIYLSCGFNVCIYMGIDFSEETDEAFDRQLISKMNMIWPKIWQQGFMFLLRWTESESHVLTCCLLEPFFYCHALGTLRHGMMSTFPMDAQRKVKFPLVIWLPLWEYWPEYSISSPWQIMTTFFFF